ncbi:adenylate/guanylate cyclase domain-containing protein, partial [Trichocoleus sp. ST-U3]
EVNEFLRRLKNDKLEIGGLFITDRSGKPLAKSTGNQCAQTEPNQLLKSEDDFIRGTVKYLEKKFGNLSKIDQSNPLEFELNGDRQFIQVTPLTDDYGLDWLIVVVIPENTVIEQINANTRTSIWLYSTALGMATAVVILSFHWTRLRAENAHLQHLAQLKDEFLAAASRFVPRDFLDFLGKSIIDVELGDQVRKEMTIMFSDIRSFTTMSEKMSPQENFNFINDYLGKVSPAIRNQGGIIDKYIGDAIMALFPQQSAEAALQAAIEMQREVSIYNEHRLKNGYQPIAIGVGLHTGILRLGTIGEPERMETTVISDAVNLASRLEGLTKLYGAGILISGETLFKLPPSKYSYRWLGQVKVKGRDESVSVFEVYDAEPATIVELKNKTKTAFETSLLLYSQKNFAQANQIFQEILQINPQDRAAKMYVERCEYYQEHEVPEEWSRMEDFNLVKQ